MTPTSEPTSQSLATPRAPYAGASPRDLDCGEHVGDVVTVATFGDRRMGASDPLTDRTRVTWSSGDFGRIAVGYAAGAEAFVQRLGVAPGERILDVACGTGNLAIPAARAGATVTGIDIAPNLVAAARAAASRQRLDIAFDEGDAESLPYGDASFHTTMSMFGVMFAPRPERAMAELFRVTRPGGRIAMANWTPDGFVGEMLRAHVALVPPPAGVPSVLAWGDAEQVNARLAPFASRIRRLRFVPTLIEMAFPLSALGVVELFRETYGPTVRAFAALDHDGRAQLGHDLLALWSGRSIARDGMTCVRAEYLDVRIELR